MRDIERRFFIVLYTFLTALATGIVHAFRVENWLGALVFGALLAGVLVMLIVRLTEERSRD